MALRGLGAREIVLHGVAIAAALRDRPVRPFLAASIAGDLADIAATVGGRRGLPDGRRAGDRSSSPAGRRCSPRASPPPSTASELAFDRRGTGPALVLLHPLGADRHVWEPVMDRLTAERDVIARRPARLRRVAVAQRRRPAHAGGARRRRRRRSCRTAAHHVAGNSLGGWVALELAAAGHARSVTAIAPAGPVAAAAGAEARDRARAARRPSGPACPRSSAARRAAGSRSPGTVAHAERVPPEAALRLVRAYADAPGFEAVNDAMRASRFTRLEHIRVPVTLAWPEHDHLVARPAHLPPTVRNVVLPGAGHVPMWDAPDLVADVLLQGSR